MSYHHAFARINLRVPYRLANAFPVQFEYLISSRLILKCVFLIGFGASNSIGRRISLLERVDHILVFDFDLAIAFPGDRIFTPMCRASAKTGEADATDRDDIRLNQVALAPKRRFVA